MFFVILLIILLIWVFGYCIKKEFFENQSSKASLKYNNRQINHAINAFLQSFHETHQVIKVFRVLRTGSIIEFEIMLHNMERFYVEKFYAKVKLPFKENKKEEYKVLDFYSLIPTETIKNGTTSIQSSASLYNQFETSS